MAISTLREYRTMCSPEMAAEDDSWWRDERYVIQHLNVNSAIAYPQHDEEVVVSMAPTYTIKGYAYSGGGRQVSRIEVSLDSGKSKPFTLHIATCANFLTTLL